MPSFSSVAVDFTDGDTFKRFSINAIDVKASSIILPSCQRTVSDAGELNDNGWTFHPCVRNVYAGGFDVDVVALNMGEPVINNDSPNELVQLNFVIY